MPRPDHIVILIEENKAANSIIGSASAPFINSLAAGGAAFSQSYAIEHPSQPNYLDLFSGSNQGVTTDSLPAGIPFTTSNLAANLRAKGVSFAGYSESLPSTGLTADSTVAGGYRRKHNPWVNWQNDSSPTANQLPSSINRDFSAFPTDFTKLPAVSIVIPTQYNDMHDDKPGDNLNAIQAGDAWAKAHLDAYAQWAKANNSLLIVTFDEDDTTQNNQISTVFYGQPVKPGVYSETINHFSVLRTIEDMYGTAYAGASATATPITDVWVGSTTQTVTPIATGSTWKYLDAGASLDAVNWKVNAYSDTGWKSGLAQLGYGDGDEKTIVSYGTDPNKKFTTTYFRKNFTIDNTATFTSLNLHLLRDDGAVVYLNGTEIARSNMPTGTIISATFAPVAIGGTDEFAFYNFTVNPLLLLQGNNTLAVEVHQSNLTSSDLSFDLSLDGSVTAAGQLNVTNVPTGSTWKYLDTGASLDALAWKTNAYVDTAWKSGAAQLGYGDGDEKTVVGYGADANKKFATTYFRKTFSVVNPAVYRSLTLQLLRDDGAVVYLNGTEVARSNMPTGAITSATFAPVAVGGADENAFFTFVVNPSLLLAGNNTLAVEIHQSNLTSTDISFDLSLASLVTNTNPTIASLSATPNPVGSGSKVGLTANTVFDFDGAVDNVKFYRESNAVAGLQIGTASDDLLVGTDTSSTGGYTVSVATTGLALTSYTYYARATDNFGAVGNIVSAANTIHANVAPKITSLSVSPPIVTAGATIVLTANSVSDADGAMTNVIFYRESNGIAGLQVGGANNDLVVGTDASNSGGWTASILTTGLSGSYTYYARATDTAGAVSNVVSIVSTVN